MPDFFEKRSPDGASAMARTAEAYEKQDKAFMHALHGRYRDLQTVLSTQEGVIEGKTIAQAALDILGRPSLPDENHVLELRKQLSALGVLYRDLENGCPSRLETVLGNAAFMMMKPMFLNYLHDQKDLFTHRIAFHNALEQKRELEAFYPQLLELKAQFPNAQLSMLILQRHEMCTNKDKGFGFHADAELHAMNPETAKKQSKFDLKAAQEVISKQVDFLKQMGIVGGIEMLISNVKRAQQTAMHASIEKRLLESQSISALFGEKQSLLPLVCSGRAKELPSEAAHKMNSETASMPGEEKETKAEDNFLIPAEMMRWEFEQRLERAFDRLMQAPPQSDRLPMRILVGHGGMNKALLRHLRQALLQTLGNDGGIPEKPLHLDFGSQYRILLVRDENNKLLSAHFLGVFTRFGEQQNREPELYERKAHILKEIQGTKNEASKAQLLFEYCELEEDLSKIKALLDEASHAVVLLDHLDLLPLEDLEHAEFMAQYLLAKDLETVNAHVKRNAGLGSTKLFFKDCKYALTQKNPNIQKFVLDNLAKAKGLSDLDKLDKVAKEHLNSGKVTNLLAAFRNIFKAKVAKANQEAEASPKAEGPF